MAGAIATAKISVGARGEAIAATTASETIKRPFRSSRACVPKAKTSNSARVSLPAKHREIVSILGCFSGLNGIDARQAFRADFLHLSSKATGNSADFKRQASKILRENRSAIA